MPNSQPEILSMILSNIDQTQAETLIPNFILSYCVISENFEFVNILKDYNVSTSVPCPPLANPFSIFQILIRKNIFKFYHLVMENYEIEIDLEFLDDDNKNSFHV